MKKKHFFLGAGILIFPIVVFYLLNTGKPQYAKLPIFGEKIEPNGADVKDTIYYQVPDFKVVNQYGDTVTQRNLNDGIYLANFFFTTCKDVCPSMNRRVKRIYDEMMELAAKNEAIAKKNKVANTSTPVKFISFTVDPETDSVPLLSAYAKRFDVTGNNWYFVTAGKEAIFKVGQGFLLPVSIEDRTIDHSQQILLIDKQNRIRGMYNTLDDADMKRLQGEIKVLLYEYTNN
jgi:protein SCO1/2